MPMRFIFENYVKPALIAIAALAIAGACALPAKNAASKASPRNVDSDTIRAALGNGMLFGVLGGYRSLISDFVWIKGYLDWEKKDLAACIASIQLATEIDPYMISFWTQGTSIIAFDTPHWIIAKLPKDKRTAELMDIVKKKQTRIALKFIDRALKIFPANQELLIQKGQIAIGAGFFDIAEKAYAAVAAQPDPQIYVRRIYSSLLLKNGKFKQALKVLESILPDIEPDSPLQQIIPQQIEKTKELIKKTQL